MCLGAPWEAGNELLYSCTRMRCRLYLRCHVLLRRSLVQAELGESSCVIAGVVLTDSLSREGTGAAGTVEHRSLEG